MLRQKLPRSVLLLVAALVTTSMVVIPSPPGQTETPLTRAIIQSLRNSARLILRDRPPRPARRQDVMVPGDALVTAQASLAELRFNDGSLARIGERALFRFAPRTRTFRLDNGTVLLLIPPGQGQTRVRTPNSIAGIRGSALFVQYAPETDTTVVGALTNSGIQVGNRNRSQNQPLQAGQLAVVVKDRITRVYNFDLKTFYETNDLVQGLELTQKPVPGQDDPAIAAVRAETIEALQEQHQRFQNPDLTRLSRLKWLPGLVGAAVSQNLVAQLEPRALPLKD